MHPTRIHFRTPSFCTATHTYSYTCTRATRRTDLLDVCRRLGRRLQKDEIMLVRKLLALLHGDCASVIKVRLVADEHDGHVAVAVVPSVVQPRDEVVERLAPETAHKYRPHAETF